MAWEYLIDGYNFLWTTKVIRHQDGPGNLERARQALLAWLGRRLQAAQVAFADRKGRLLVTVVFDAHGSLAADAESVFSLPQSPVRIQVRFALDYPNADSMIGELCDSNPHPDQLLVVSDDREVQRHARRAKATPLRCQEFLLRLQGAMTQPTRGHSADTGRLRSAVEGRSNRPPNREQPTEADTAYWAAIFQEAADDEVELPEPAPPPKPASPSVSPRPTPGTPPPSTPEREAIGKSAKGRDRSPAEPPVARPVVPPATGTESAAKPAKRRAPNPRKPPPLDEVLTDFYAEMRKAMETLGRDEEPP